MSFLQNIQDGKLSLKQTETYVTCADGSRYIEKHSSSTENKIILDSTIGFVIDHAPDEIPALVVQNLYLGSQDCCVPEVLQKYRINCVLSIGIESPHKMADIAYTHIECLDLPDTDVLRVIAHCNPIIKCALESGKSMLVHCNAGVSRSAAVVIGYLISEANMSFEAAYQLIKTARRCVQPNPGFVKQLKRL